MSLWCVRLVKKKVTAPSLAVNTTTANFLRPGHKLSSTGRTRSVLAAALHLIDECGAEGSVTETVRFALGVDKKSMESVLDDLQKERLIWNHKVPIASPHVSHTHAPSHR